MGMPNEQEDIRLQSLLNIIPSLSKKDVKSVKLTFVALIDVVKYPGRESATEIVPQMEVTYKESRE